MRGLSTKQLAQFEKDGYLVLRRLVSQRDVSMLVDRVASLVAAFDPKSSDSVFDSERQRSKGMTFDPHEDRYFLESGDCTRFFWEADAFDEGTGELTRAKELCLNKIGHALHYEDPVVRNIVARNFRPVAMSLFKDPRPLQSMYIFKQPEIGGAVTPHQDSTFLYTEPESCIGSWLALHPARKNNGCLYVVPGSHKNESIGLSQRYLRSTKPGEYRTYFEPAEVAPLPTEPSVALEADPGDVVLLHGRVVHFSAANTSDVPRHSFTVHTIEGGAHYPRDNWLQNRDGSPFAPFPTEADSPLPADYVAPL
ncbi:MAG: hypothetical protein MHM6MM_002117 [Cercozoa sp. M6MM]